MKSFVPCCMLLLGAGVLFSPVRAATCTLNATGINFGNYDPTSNAAVTANGSISFRCTGTGTGDTVSVMLSTGNSGTYTNRTLALGTQTLDYNIYADSGYTAILGNGTGGSYYLYACYGKGSGSPCGNSGGYPSGTTFSGAMYGQMPGGQDVGAGTYTDNLTVILTF